MEFFNNMESLLQVFWYIAIPVSIIFVIQTILTFVGMDGSDGVEADFDSDFDGDGAPFQLFSLRNLINFLLGFSWTGVLFYNSITNTTLLVLLSLAVGTLFVVLFFLMIKQILKLAEDNTFKMEHTVGQIAQVYLTIPEQKTGTGKVQVSVRGTSHELNAITDGERLNSGEMVRVVRIETGNLLVVEKI
jgi:membrane protein implicated in regulation of membrane protease activity